MKKTVLCLIFIITIIFCAENIYAAATTSTSNSPVFSGGGIDKGVEIVGESIKGAGLVESTDVVAVTMGWVKFALGVIGIGLFVGLVASGGMYVFAFVNEENAEKAKKNVTWMGIGLIIIMISYSVVATVIRGSI